MTVKQRAQPHSLSSYIAASFVPSCHSTAVSHTPVIHKGLKTLSVTAPLSILLYPLASFRVSFKTDFKDTGRKKGPELAVGFLSVCVCVTPVMDWVCGVKINVCKIINFVANDKELICRSRKI